MPTQESENFYRIITLLVNVGSPILRRLFLNYAHQYAQSVTSGAASASSGSGDVYIFLVNHQGPLMQLYKKKVIRQEQLRLLTPSTGNSVILDDWDISLLTTVLKAICPLSNTEMIETDNLRKARNAMFAHKSTASMQLSDFLAHWQSVESCALTLLQSVGDTQFEKENVLLMQKADITIIYLQIKTGPLDVGGTAETLTMWYRQDMVVGDRLESLDDKMNQLMEQVSKIAANGSDTPKDPVFQAITRNSNTLLDAAKEHTFVLTEQFEEAKNKLTSESAVMLLGDEGDGKTTLGLQLMLKHHPPDKCLVLQDPNMWEHVDTRHLDIILIDDMFGKIPSNECKRAPLQLLDPIQSSVTSKSIKVIMTSRRLTFQEVKSDLVRYDMFKHVVDMSSEGLSLDMKATVLKSHLLAQKNSIADDDVNECCSCYNLPFGFMKQCHLFARNVNVFRRGRSAFSLPIEYLTPVLKSLTKTQYLALLLLFYRRGLLGESELKPTRRKMTDTSSEQHLLTQVKELAQSVGVNGDILTKPVLKECLNRLCVNFLTCQMGNFSFRSRSMYVCIGLLHGKEYPEDISEMCDLEFLCNNVSETIGPDKVFIDIDCFEVVAERFAKAVIENGAREQVAVHSLLANKDFCDHLVEQLCKKGTLRAFLDCDDDSFGDSFMVLFLQNHPDVSCLYLLKAILPSLQHDHNYGKTESSDSHCCTWQCSLLSECLVVICANDMRSSFDTVTTAGILGVTVLKLVVERGSKDIVESYLDTLQHDGVLTKGLCEDAVAVAKNNGKQETESLLQVRLQQLT